MPRPKTVPYAMYLREKERADKAEDAYHDLVDKMLAFKPKAPKPPESSDEERVKEVEAGLLVRALSRPEAGDVFVEGMVRDLVADGLSEPAARAEALRIRREVVETSAQAN